MATEGKAPFRSAWGAINRALGRSLGLLREETRLPKTGSTLWLNWWLESTGSGQTLTLTLLDDSADTFYAPTISAATPQPLTVPLTTNTQAFYGPTISAATPQPLTVPLTTNTQAFYGPTISHAGSDQTLTLTLLDDSVDTFYGPALSHASPQTLTLTLLDDSADTFYGIVLSQPTTQTLTLTLLDDSEDTFYGITLSHATSVGELVVGPQQTWIIRPRPTQWPLNPRPLNYPVAPRAREWQLV